ncbi:MAG TPA: bifunctional chorismate mutase/prephenate dehydratase [Thermoanaerobaculia bacterium]|jgi:chorismate mutase/prephenate dehydratase|nr:bifunctional chorismate mutase/prephenate dehydratase [Thermoanaerobaculia bacterium]
MRKTTDLQTLRESIEAVDREILAHIRQRMSLVEQVVGAKLDAAVPFRDPQREELVLQRVRHAAVEQGLDAHEIERLYRVILEMSVAHQRAHVRSLATAPLRVSYQGVEGSYSHLTAQRRYAGTPEGVLLEGFETFRRAAQAVREGTADVALLPIENTTAGSINETYDLLAEGGLTITAEEVSRIDHCLVALPGARLEELHTVISHPQALRQCEDFLHGLPAIRAREEFDTAGAARKVRDGGDRGVAAIASEAAGALFGLEVLRRSIQSQEGNSTRFVELSPHPVPCPPGTPAKTSLLIVLGHRPGTLAELLGLLSRRGINLTKLESRPVPSAPWQYRFYLDLEGHAAEDPLRSALAEAGEHTTELRVLGTYPSAEPQRGSKPL